ncbi:MAG: hypothetical protein SGJ27_24690 [Candidatus Melainabacteria bacterium]|nr:hypothetical protein [Candidatus Melainabacteria bacterium]
MKNMFTGILGSAAFCAAFEMVVNLMAYGDPTKIVGSLVIGSVLGAIIGGAIALFRPDRPVVTGTIAGTVLCAAIIALLAAVNVTAITSLLSLVLVAVTVIGIGASSGLGYRVFGPAAVR